MSAIDIERRGRIAIVRMRRPEHGNRVSRQMAEEMAAALENARRSVEVGACVLTGHGLKDPDTAVARSPEVVRAPATIEALERIALS